ncbi:MAG: hypothetical protein D084_Lepto4C00137G0002 [Leptospirillum sp. Group IV 'UBA BS']|nr:MAG: hypothetical protein D084_Lepto4C00137G0002 [Leptospirillum sp. Group IV 'UBA BS']
MDQQMVVSLPGDLVKMCDGQDLRAPSNLVQKIPQDLPDLPADPGVDLVVY